LESARFAFLNGGMDENGRSGFWPDRPLLVENKLTLFA
jgi:hypothetical protein